MSANDGGLGDSAPPARPVDPVAAGSMDRALRATAARRRWLRGWEGLWRGAAAGLLLIALSVGAGKLFPLPPSVPAWAGGAAAVAAIAGFAAAFWRPTTRREAARWLDARQGLAEKLGTAVALGEPGAAAGPAEADWRRLVLRDAEAAAAGLDPKKLLPLGAPRAARAAAIAAALAGGLCFAPPYRSAGARHKEAERAAIRDVGKNLEDLSKRELQKRPPALEPSRKALEEVQDFGQRLQQAKLSRDEALKDLAKVTESVRRQAEELARNPVLQQLAQAARAPDGSANPDAAALQKRIEAMQQQLGKAADHPEALDKLQAQMDKLKAAAQSSMAGPPGAAQKAQAQLSQMAAELARQAEAAGMPLPSLDEAVAALQNAQVEQFLRDLNIADLDLKKLAETAKALAKMQQQAERLGKDLPEQLKNGQAEAAIDSLERMKTDVLKMNPAGEDLKRLLDELKRAEPNATFSRELSSALNRAAKEAKDGKPAAAAKAMADAQAELRKMLDQMADAQSMMAALKNLDQASLCLGNGQSWNPTGMPGPPKSGQSAKGGRGVGTWSENSAWATPDHIDDLWDNSGLPSRDQAAKGLTERDKSLPDTFSPTKIKGQMQPGSPMPSITLKGVSLKGQSRIQSAQTETAAQDAGQAAQNQDQVPKAYRSAVRDYFDDSKK